MITAIFDLDGTIADSLRDLAEAVNYGLRELGLPEHSTESYKLRIGNGAIKLCERALPEDRKELTAQLHKLFKEHYSVHCMDHTKAYDGIPELIKELSDNGICLAVATNKPQDAARKIISELLPGINFAKVLGGTEDRPKKPDPAVIRDILSDMPEDNTVYMIGDSNVDIKTAKNAGLISIGCTWGFRTREVLLAEGADFIVDSAADILPLILR